MWMPCELLVVRRIPPNVGIRGRRPSRNHLDGLAVYSCTEAFFCFMPLRQSLKTSTRRFMRTGGSRPRPRPLEQHPLPRNPRLGSRRHHGAQRLRGVSKPIGGGHPDRCPEDHVRSRGDKGYDDRAQSGRCDCLARWATKSSLRTMTCQAN